MLWLALHPPQLSLEAFCTTLPPGQRCAAVALLAGHRIAAASAAAVQRGVQPGLKRATALALVPDLVLGEADAARDAAALQALAHAALGFTPMVALDGTDCVLLEVQSSLRLFGGLPGLLRRLRQTLLPLGHGVQVAAAPTAAAAALLARWRDDLAEGPHLGDAAAFGALLDAVPAALPGPARAHAEAFQGMGLATLADLRALPRAGLVRRFGQALATEIDRAWGLCPDPRHRVLLPEVFEARLELFCRADTAVQVLDGAAVLLARLVAWAGARHARIGAFVLQMRHEPRHRSAREQVPALTELAVELAEPALDAAHLQVLLRERLARCPLPAPTLELRLECRHLVQGAAPNGELFPTRQGEAEGLTRLLERLRSRLGDEGVRQLLPLADHRPERAARSGAVALRRAQAPQPVHAAVPVSPALPLHRPVWLLAEPQPLAERQALPLLQGRPLQLLGGPERIESGWWDGEPAVRDYFIAQHPDGSLVWVYRLRLPAPGGRPDASWFLHGLFG